MKITNYLFTYTFSINKAKEIILIKELLKLLQLKNIYEYAEVAESLRNYKITKVLKWFIYCNNNKVYYIKDKDMQSIK